MSNETTEQRSGCGPRLVWIAKAVFAFLLVVGVLVAITWGGVMIYQMVQTEINRSSESVSTRFDAQESRIDLLREETNALVAANPGQEEQLRQLQVELTAVSAQLATLDADLIQQESILATLEPAMATTLNNDETAAGNIVVLSDSLTALQDNFNESSLRLDAFGGEVDGLTGEVVALNETAVLAQEMAATSETAVTDMAQTLMLFRAWELVARARLRLLENNAGLAQSDVAEADEMLRRIILILPEDAPEIGSLQTVQTRLALATDNLAVDTTLAGADLETAWDALDTVLVARLLDGEALDLEIDVGEETAVPQALPPTLTPPQSTAQSVTSTPTSTPASQETPTAEATTTPSS